MIVVAGVLQQDGKLLIGQRMAKDRHGLKWEFPGGKVEIGETPKQALRRELQEELGIRPSISPVGSFVYRAVDPTSDLVEHELDHVFVGLLTDRPIPDPAEVADVQLVEPGVLVEELRDPLRSTHYTPWLADVMAIATKAYPS